MLLTQPKIPLNFFLASAGLLAGGQLGVHQDHSVLFCKAALQLGSVKGWMIKTEVRAFTHKRVDSPHIAKECSVQKQVFNFAQSPWPRWSRQKQSQFTDSLTALVRFLVSSLSATACLPLKLICSQNASSCWWVNSSTLFVLDVLNISLSLPVVHHVDKITSSVNKLLCKYKIKAKNIKLKHSWECNIHLIARKTFNSCYFIFSE